MSSTGTCTSTWTFCTGTSTGTCKKVLVAKRKFFSCRWDAVGVASLMHKIGLGGALHIFKTVTLCRVRCNLVPIIYTVLVLVLVLVLEPYVLVLVLALACRVLDTRLYQTLLHQCVILSGIQTFVKLTHSGRSTERFIAYLFHARRGNGFSRCGGEGTVRGLFSCVSLHFNHCSSRSPWVAA